MNATAQSFGAAAGGAGGTDQQSVVIAASFTAAPLKDPLEFWLAKLGLNFQLEFAPGDQVAPLLLDPGSPLNRQGRGGNIVLLRWQDWLGQEVHTTDSVASLPLHSEAPKLEARCQEFVDLLLRTRSQPSLFWIVAVCPADPALEASPRFQAIAARLAETLVRGLQAADWIQVISPGELDRYYPVPEYFDPIAARVAQIPYQPVFFSAVGTLLARKIWRQATPMHKVVVLDCDRTLWRGTCGEAGPLGVDVDAGSACLQRFMIRLQQQGLLLCLCSRNDEADVFAVFDQHPGMQLHRRHLVAWRINWNPKSENLRSLAAELSLGLDSFIFIDDDPFECAEVQAAHPEVLTLQLPGTATEFPAFLDHVWAFDQIRPGHQAGLDRTDFYRRDVQRRELGRNAASFAEFLADLAVQVRFTPFSPEHGARVSQLFERTHQFNLANQSRTARELEQQVDSGGFRGLVVDVEDRFGSYGQVGFVLWRVVGTALHVEDFLLSCRALNRGVEHRILAHLGEVGAQQGLAEVRLRFRSTARNQPARRFLESVGADPSVHGGEETGWMLTTGAARAARPPDQWPDPAPAAGQTRPTENSPAPAARAAAFRARLVAEIARDLATPAAIHQRLVAAKSRPRPERAGRVVTPENLIESRLVELWRELLATDQIGIRDDFFEFGGDSLLVVQLQIAVQRTFGVHFELGAWIRSPTIHALAQLIQDHWVDALPAREVEQMLEEVEALSEIEAEELRRQESGAVGPHPLHPARSTP